MLKLEPLTVTFVIRGAAKFARGFVNPRDGSCGDVGRRVCTFCSCRESEEGEVTFLCPPSLVSSIYAISK